MPEAVVAALGAAAVGAVWSSCSPDFGVRGVLDRFGQIEPRMLVAADGYRYAGKVHDSHGRSLKIVAALPSVEQVVVIPYCRRRAGRWAWRERLRRGTTSSSAARRSRIDFASSRCRSIIRSTSCISSGTTGVPKCIVHGAGGTLIQHLKEHQLHCDIRAGDRVFYFTTCGWMMWNWLVSRAGVGGDDRALRRVAVSPRRPRPVRLRRRRRHDPLRHLGEVPRRRRRRRGSRRSNAPARDACAR